jgi:prevent-host-death family protein
MIEVSVQEAKARLSRLLALVEDGEDIVILRRGKPVARLTALAARSQFSLWRHARRV